jgi:diguanylate cyclase (GGDEF)-like protein
VGEPTPADQLPPKGDLLVLGSPGQRLRARLSAAITPVTVYQFAVALAGCGLTVLAFRLWPPVQLDGYHLQFWLFAIAVVISELRPVVVSLGQGTSQMTVSTTFAFALLLTVGVTPAVLVLGLASAVGDLVTRRSLIVVAFNVGQYAIAMFVCGFVLDRMVGFNPGIAHFPPLVLAWVTVAGAAFFVINFMSIAVLIRIARGVSLRAYVREEGPLGGLITGMLLAIAPIVVVIVREAPVLLPVVFAPMLMAYRTAVVSSEKEHQALHDALTGLPNRTLFFKHVEQAVVGARRAGLVSAVMIVDLDRFKEINDTLGHHVGDVLLGQVGERLQSVVGAQASVARLGGDEFGVVLGNVLERAEVEGVAAKIVDALEQPFTIANMRLDVGASIGSALFPEHGEDADTLIQRADIAMYAAKAGSGDHLVYSPVHDQHSPERLALVGELREAIGQGRLVLHYQPKVVLGTRQVEGVEALVRWPHPERGLVAPDEFIPLAERTGLIRPLTTVVIEQALAQCRAWQGAGFPMVVAVNLSARILQDVQLPSDVARLLAAAGVEARWLKLELTESMVMEDRVRAVEVLDRLHAMGVSLSIDDFGTGYSSLAYLKRLPVDEIKIDKSFILHMAVDGNDALIARSTVDLGHNLGLRVVAEGVETPEVWSQLEAMGCDIAQGYLISRPLPAEELTRWLTNWANRHTGATGSKRLAAPSAEPVS